MSTRKERVVLELESNVVAATARDAAAIELLNQRVNSLSRDAVTSRKASREISSGNDDVTKSAQRAEAQIDKLSGRMRILGDLVAILGPGLVPIAAVGIPAITGIAGALGFAAVGAGVFVGAFQGVGDALKAVNKAHLDPTTANLKAAREAMAAISPEAQAFVRQLRSMIPALKALRDSGAEAMFPGLTAGLDALESRLPDLERIMSAVGGELGDIGHAVGDSLASERWDDFFTFLEDEAPGALADMATATGNLGHAAAAMWMNLNPSNTDFLNWLVDATGRLDDMATNLGQTNGLAEFLTYVDDVGPQVGQTLGAIANAGLQIIEATAPLGGPVLHALEATANVIAAIADSDLGTPLFAGLAALALYNRTLAVTQALSRNTFGGPVVAQMRAQGAGLKTLRGDWTAYNAVTRTAQGRAQASAAQMIAHREAAEKLKGTLRSTAAQAGKAGALIGGLTLVTTGAADGIGLTNTASLALMGTMAGPWGAAIGGGVGAVLDLSHASDDLTTSLTTLKSMAGNVSLDQFTKQAHNAQKQIDDLKKSTGVRDLLSDSAKLAKGVFSGRGWTDAAVIKSYQADKDAAEAKQDLALRNRGAAQANAANDAAAALAARGYKLVGSAARSAGQDVRSFTSDVQSANDTLTRKGSIDAYQSSLLDAADALKENGRGLQGNTRDAIANRTALRNIAGGALEAATNMHNFEKRTLFLDKARGEFIRMAEAMGASPPKARAMANAFGLVDRVSKTGSISVRAMRSEIAQLRSKIVDVRDKDAPGSAKRIKGLRAQISALQGKIVKAEEKGAAPSRTRIQRMQDAIRALKSKSVKMDQHGAEIARGKIAALRDAINSLRSRTVTINYHGTKTGTFVGGRAASAYGNIFPSVPASPEVRAYAYGDVANRHKAELAGPGTTRIWREPETQGEAYIPLANDDRRPRARAIAEETVAILGGDIEWYAKGGRKGGSAKPSARTTGLRHRLHELEAAVHDSTAAIKRERTARDALVAKRDELKGTVAGKFKTDLFGDSDVWAAGGGNPLGVLKADTAKAKAFQAVLKRLRQNGLNGDALAELASTGDIGKAQAMLSMGKTDIKRYETLYDQRTRAANQVGAYAGTAAYGTQITAQTKHLRSLVHQNKVLEHRLNSIEKAIKHSAKETGHEVGKAVNHSAGKSKSGR